MFAQNLKIMKVTLLEIADRHCKATTQGHNGNFVMLFTLTAFT